MNKERTISKEDFNAILKIFSENNKGNDDLNKSKKENNKNIPDNSQDNINNTKIKENIDINKEIIDINNKEKENKTEVINEENKKKEEKKQISIIEEKTIKEELNNIEENFAKLMTNNITHKENDNNKIIKEENHIIKDNNEINIENNNKKQIVSLSKNTIEEWKELLCKNIPHNVSFVNYQINQCLYQSEENLKAIQKDVARTRGKETSMYSDYQKNLEFLICFYCNYNIISYKQGLNEIIGALLIFKYQFNFSLEEIFYLSQGLINKFAQNYYYEKTIFSLKSSLSLLTLLLKYHKPQIFNLLDKLMIDPTMYATNWLLTIFSSRLELDLTYYFWNILIGIDDQLFVHYFIVALLIFNEDKILKEEKLNIPILMTKLTINNVDEMGKILKIAIKLRDETPYSFRLLANKLEIFKYHSDNIEKCFEKYKPQSLVTMPIFPSEIFYICYNGIIKCPDDLCKNYLRKNIHKYESKHHICEHCKMKINKKIEYILLDLRILEYGSFEDENEKTGFLPKMIMVEQNELKSDDFVEKIKERFLSDKGHYHFIFMTSRTSYFKSFEDDYYIEKPSGHKLLSEQIKVEKELNEELTRKMTIRNKFKLKEYDNLKKLLITLLNANYPYISFCYGGFTAIHELITKFDISLLNHDPNCNLCKDNKGQNHLLDNFKMWKFNNKKKDENTINEKEEEEISIKIIDKIPINEIYKNIEENKYDLFLCQMKHFNSHKYTKNNECMITFQEFEIYIFKFTLNTFDLGLIKVFNISKIYSIERKNTIIKLKFNEGEKKNKIIIDLVDDKTTIKFMDIYGKKKFEVEKKNREKEKKK